MNANKTVHQAAGQHIGNVISAAKAAGHYVDKRDYYAALDCLEDAGDRIIRARLAIAKAA
jgi:hypothetical protein